MRFFWILFVALPITEMLVLIKVGQSIGALPTIGLILLMAVLGLALLRKQGYAAIGRARQTMEQGGIPAAEFVEGLFLAVGGVLFLIPGFITDLLGLCCLIPGLRRTLIGWGMARVTKNRTEVDVRAAGSGKTIEGEYRRED